MATVWLLCGYCVATVWLLCGYCVAAVWQLCGYYVATAWLLCCILWIRMKPMSMTERRTHVRMHKRATQLLTEWEHEHDEIPSQCERKKRSFANMSSFTILPPSPPQSMLGTIAHQDLDEKERFFRIGSTAKMKQH